eukprot:PhF_6_TR26052/c1_g1_i6/m.36690
MNPLTVFENVVPHAEQIKKLLEIIQEDRVAIANLKATIEGMKKGDEMPQDELPGQVTDLFKDLMTIPAALDDFHQYYEQYGISEESTIKASFFHLPPVIRDMIKGATEEKQKDAEVSWNKWKMFVLEQVRNVVGSDRILQLIDEVRIEQGDYLAEKHSMLQNLCWLQHTAWDRSAKDIRREGWAHLNRKLPPLCKGGRLRPRLTFLGSSFNQGTKEILRCHGKAT